MYICVRGLRWGRSRGPNKKVSFLGTILVCTIPCLSLFSLSFALCGWLSGGGWLWEETAESRGGVMWGWGRRRLVRPWTGAAVGRDDRVQTASRTGTGTGTNTGSAGSVGGFGRGQGRPWVGTAGDGDGDGDGRGRGGGDDGRGC